MIRYIVNFALKNPWIVVGLGILLFIWGIISFKNLPIDAYPDVANNYVNIIVQWPGHSAEDMEKQVTVPCEIQMAGIPHMANLRSFTLAGISSIMMNFDDESDNNWNRERVVERIGMIKLGMFVTATFQSRQKQRFALVPAPAILHLHDRDWVYVPAGGNQFRRVEVKAGDMVGGKQGILAGIQSGQQVVSNVLQLEATLEAQ